MGRNVERDKERNLAYYYAHREEINKKRREYQKAYREAHRDYYRRYAKGRKAYSKNYRKEHKEELKIKRKEYYEKNKKQESIRNANFRLNHLERYLVYEKEYRDTHKEYYREYRKNYEKEHRDIRNERRRERHKTDVNYKLSINLRRRLNHAIKGNLKTGSSIRDLGCTLEYFINVYMPSLFSPGMTWDNWGRGKDKWHIDHIIPLSSFDLTDEEQLKRAVHYTNLQPLWAEENLRKGNKLIGEINVKICG